MLLAAFCLPLDFVSQLVINLVFFCINTSSALCQVAYQMAMLVARCPRLLWFQLAIECIVSAAVWPVQLMLEGLRGLIVNDCTAPAGDAGSGACPAMQGAGAAGRLTVAEQVAQPAGLVPDMDTLAGRFVLAASLALLLLVVLYMPLLFAWRLKLHFKSRFIAHAVRRGGGRIRAELPGGITAVGDAVPACEVSCGGGSRPARSGFPASGASTKGEVSSEKECMAGAGLSCKVLAADRSNCSSYSGKGGCGAAGSVCGSAGAVQSSSACAAAGGTSVHVSQLGTFPVVPPLSVAVVKHALAAAGVCFLLGEGFMALCMASPAVKGLLWPQIPLAPAP